MEDVKKHLWDNNKENLRQKGLENEKDILGSFEKEMEVYFLNV